MESTGLFRITGKSMNAGKTFLADYWLFFVVFNIHFYVVLRDISGFFNVRTVTLLISGSPATGSWIVIVILKKSTIVIFLTTIPIYPS